LDGDLKREVEGLGKRRRWRREVEVLGGKWRRWAGEGAAGRERSEAVRERERLRKKRCTRDRFGIK
jgi:hypothetical protein